MIVSRHMSYRIIMSKKALTLTQTAVLLALIVVVEYLMVGPQYILIKGSIVNLILVVATLLVGLPTGILISIFTPLLAIVTGHLAMPVLAPVVAVGNLVFVILWWLIVRHVKVVQSLISYVIATIVSSLAKFDFLYLAVAWYILPVMLKGIVAKKPQIKVALLAQFGMPQLITAVIGGVIAMLILPRLVKAIQSIEKN
ncbi:ECF transporter S component [Lactococcus laudensis]|uniref:ECF transporter S component n=2 Tax=Pseudolactococcus laudensis TaxID=1494461 RepID=UPI0012DD223E